MKKIFLPLIFLLISLFSFNFLLADGYPYTHDGENHLARFANYKVAIREGQIPPRFAPNLMNHYGYPVFNYNYPLANIISLPFSLLKFDYKTTLKIITFVFISFGMVGTYKYLEVLGFSKKTRIYSSLVFLTSPYLVSNVLFRGNIGEIMAPMLFVWLLWMIESLRNDKVSNPFFLIIVFSMFLLSHNVAVLFGIPLLLIYLFFRVRSKKNFYKFLFVFLTSILLTLWFWLPAYFEKGLVIVGSSSNQYDYVNHFAEWSQLLFSSISFGFSYSGAVDSITFAVGLPLLISLLVIFSSFILSISKKSKLPKVINLALMISILLIVFQHDFTKPIWEILPLANFIQFPWRLSLFLIVFSLPLVAYAYEILSSKLKVLLFVFTLLILRANSQIQPVDRIYKTNIDFDAFSQSTSTQNENLPVGFTYTDIGDWQPGPTIERGDGDIDVFLWNGSKRKYQLNLSERSLIIEPTMFFEGWQTMASGNELNYFNDNEIGGRIAYWLEPGNYQIETKFTQKTPFRILGNAISVFAALGLIIFSIIGNKKYKK